MSILAGRVAGKEGAFFLQESKQAVGRLVEKNKKHLPNPPPTSPFSSSSSTPDFVEEGAGADVLPEVLRHSLPSTIYRPTSDSSSFSRASKWVLSSDPKNASFVSADALNPLRAYVSLPQVTFGPKRWKLPAAEHVVVASTANALRHDNYTHVNPEKLKAAAEGLSQIGKAFAVATAIICGSATLMFGMAASKLDLHNSDAIRTKGRDLVQPKFEMFREQLKPVKIWADNMSKKWHLERKEEVKIKHMVKELSRILGAKTSN